MSSSLGRLEKFANSAQGSGEEAQEAQGELLKIPYFPFFFQIKSLKSGGCVTLEAHLDLD